MSSIAQELLSVNALKINTKNGFQWSSGIISPVYCDNRLALAFPSIRRTIKAGFLRHMLEFPDAESIVGVVTSGIPYAAILAEEMNMPMAYVRPKPKEHGRQQQIEGKLDEGTKVVVIEDLISTGGSSLAAVDALRAEGCDVLAVLSIVSYELDISKSNFEDNHCTLRTLISFNEILETAREMGYIEPEDIADIQRWQSAPSDWMPCAPQL